MTVTPGAESLTCRGVPPEMTVVGAGTIWALVAAHTLWNRAAMLIYSMSVSADGFMTDRNGELDWTQPSDEQFEFWLEQTSALGCYLLGRRLYEGMQVWETDPTLRDTPSGAEFADVWSALPKIVFSHSLDAVEGNARLAQASLAEEVATARAGTEKDISIGGADLAAQAIELDLIDELWMLRHPVVLGGGTPFLPPTSRSLPLDLVETRTFNDRVIYERYRRARD